LGAIRLEATFGFLAVFCADDPHSSHTEMMTCAFLIGLLPILVAIVFICGAQFARLRKRNILALILSGIPIIIALIFLGPGEFTYTAQAPNSVTDHEELNKQNIEKQFMQSK
jgi:hypothetical protein